MLKKILSALFSFPRSELENRWWNRLAKVCVVLSTIAALAVSVGWAEQIYVPSYSYSFESHYADNNYAEKRLNDVYISLSDEFNLVMLFKYSDVSGADEYVTAMENRKMSDLSMYSSLKQSGQLDH